MRSPAELNERFRSEGRKITAQRTVLFELLHDTTAHPSAEAVYELAAARTPGISLRTVYHTLNDLVEMGEMSVIAVDGRTRFDPNVHDHQHAVCESCGAIEDVYPTDDPLGTIALDGFVAHRVEVIVRGLCPRCQADTTPPTRGTNHLHTKETSQ